MDEAELQADAAEVAVANGIADERFGSVFLRVGEALRGEFGDARDATLGIGYADFGVVIDGEVYEVRLTRRGVGGMH